MAELVGNLLVAQSGGPTAVINASLAGVIQEAGRHPEVIEAEHAHDTASQAHACVQQRSDARSLEEIEVPDLH